MKTRNKILLLTLTAALLVVTTVLGTLAWLTSTEQVTNTFTVGSVEIKLDEADVDEYGEAIPNADRVTGNHYRLLPGKSYTKDPTVTVTKGSEEAYLRMIVILNNAAEWTAILGSGDFLDYVDGWDNTKWEKVSRAVDATANTITYEFRYYQTVGAVDATDDVTLEALFTSFAIPGEVTGEQLQTLSDFEITVVANAIQTLGFADEDEAWAAFDRQMNGNVAP